MNLRNSLQSLQDQITKDQNMLSKFLKANLSCFLCLVVLASTSCKEDPPTTTLSSNDPEESTTSLAKLISTEDRILYFYSDLGSLGKQMNLNKPEEWISSFDELEYILDNSMDELEDENDEVKNFVSVVLEDGLENGTIMGSVGVQNDFMSIISSAMEFRERGFNYSPEVILPLLSFDIAVQSTLIENLSSILLEEEIGLGFSSEPNKYGFFTLREDGITLARKDDIILITTQKERNAGKVSSDPLSNDSELYADLVGAQNTLIFTIPEDVKPLLSMATEIFLEELPDYYPTDGLEYLLEDAIEAYDKTTARAAIQDNNWSLSLSSVWDANSPYGKLLSKGCQGKESNPPLNLVSPSGKPLMYAVGDLCMGDDAAVFEEYLEGFINALVYDKRNFNIEDFFGKGLSDIVEELDGRYAFAIEDADSRGINLITCFVGLQNGVLKEKLEEIFSINASGIPMTKTGANQYILEDLQDIEKMYVSLEDDGIYIVGGSASSEETLERMIDGKWKNVGNSGHDGYGYIGANKLFKSTDLFDIPIEEVHIMMRLLEGLTMTLDEGRKEGAAEVSLDLSFSDKASGYDGPILWQMLRLTEEF